MKQALKELIADLIKVEEQHGEVCDTAVREELFIAIHHSFIVPKPAYSLPKDLAMFSAAGNKKVRSVLQKFLQHPDVVSAKTELDTPEARQEAFLDDVYVNGYCVDEFFICPEKVLSDEWLKLKNRSA